MTVSLNPGDRLPSELVSLVAYLVGGLGEPGRVLILQATRATIVTYSPTMLDLRAPEDISVVPLPDGPVPVEALVHNDANLTGELLVWVRAGRLIGLEQAWYTDAPPTTWPTIEDVRIS